MPAYQQLTLFANPRQPSPSEAVSVLATPTALIARVSGGVRLELSKPFCEPGRSPYVPTPSRRSLPKMS